jgi:hypothetical protein
MQHWSIMCFSGTIEVSNYFITIIIKKLSENRLKDKPTKDNYTLLIYYQVDNSINSNITYTFAQSHLASHIQVKHKRKLH